MHRDDTDLTSLPDNEGVDVLMGLEPFGDQICGWFLVIFDH